MDKTVRRSPKPVLDGDILIDAGDSMTYGNAPCQIADFNAWLGRQFHRHRFVIEETMTACSSRTESQLGRSSDPFHTPTRATLTALLDTVSDVANLECCRFLKRNATDAEYVFN